MNHPLLSAALVRAACVLVWTGCAMAQNRTPPSTSAPPPPAPARVEPAPAVAAAPKPSPDDERDDTATPTEAPQAEWTPVPDGDPTMAEISFPAGAGWQGTLVIDIDGVGIWTVGVLQVFRAYACPEIVGLDDKGRCHVLWGYSGKWKSVTTVADGTWLGGLAQGDLDPRIPGPEVYVGSQSGNVYQVIGYPDRIADNRRVARLGGREIHTLVAGDVDPYSDGPELIAFTLPGAMFRLRPKPDSDGFQVEQLLELDGRVRQAEILPQAPGRPPEIAVVMRTGVLAILTFSADGPHFETVHQLPMGMGRLSVNRDAPPDRPVIYGAVDDGRVYRHERQADGTWKNELIYAGPQGMRGCAWGHFEADASVETVAVFGYCHRLELLTRREERWSRETIFVDRDKGHWLSAGELDGRNSTDELVCSGYSGRVVLLARPPGYGLEGVLATDPLPTATATSSTKTP